MADAVAIKHEAAMTQHTPPNTGLMPPAPPAPQYDPMEDKAIAQLAYEYWTQRGCPMGSPEEDWYRAEREIRKHRGMLPPRVPD
jgi:hypothetical protein